MGRGTQGFCRLKKGIYTSVRMWWLAGARVIQGSTRAPHHLPSKRQRVVCPYTLTSDTHRLTVSHGSRTREARGVTACVTRPRSATRSLPHSRFPSHTRCHTQCLTHSDSFSRSAPALWRHLEVMEKLGNSLSCVVGVWYPRLPGAPIPYDFGPLAS